ncbi:peptidoglycan-binding domain-containing protein [Aliiroseovarius crassostreae]|uniref:peptidoglycan-binding domain-containing protein n=1 Tax=Aliiroseovarius crassostreae TaxID=154981 RepID=UPI003C7E414E
MRKLITCLAMATALPALPALAQSNQAQSSASNEPSSELQERAEATETMIEETDAANSPAEENPPSPQPPLSAETINAAQFDGAPLPDGQSALTVKLQVLLNRAGISPGVIDGYKGGMSESAIRGFESRAGLSVDGVLDAEVWAALEQFDTAGR